VHNGHKAIINEVVNHANNVGGESVLLTFEPHPRKLLHPDQPLGIITPLHQKLRLINEAGIKHIVIVPFTEVFAHQSPQTYIKEFLIDKFHPHSIVIGYDHRFGHSRAGNIEMLKQYAIPYNYKLKEIHEQLIAQAVVSSTKIRNAIKEGNVEDAALMLGRSYTMKATVIHGNKLGRTIGYPTANLQPNETDQVIPAVGIYAIHAQYHNNSYNGMLSIGYNPTVSDGTELRIEANLFDFDKQIYGSQIEISFEKKLRDEEKFPSLDALKEQLHKDKISAETALADKLFL
jgi:riboflavin kinase/FMN adenylyltransferase